MLATHGLRKVFGGLTATDNVSLTLATGARHALIGPNGAGKTTLVNLLTGTFPPTAGRIELGGDDITALPSHVRVQRGLARTFQINQLFMGFTPEETLALAVAQREGLARRMLKPLGSFAPLVDEVADLLARFHLTDFARRRVRELAYGQQRLVEIALAVAARPRVLLLDEPVAGVPTGESGEILDTLAALPADVSVLLIEHDMDLVFRFATQITVLVNGAVLVEGPSEAIARDPAVKAAYLGEAVHG
ncbi:MAG: ABC transporter ATP-binding protein [Proteobacteria bacterium]|nr:ABC transporter ATP-binding protein [Pseudomonadota bacterium]